MLRRAFLSTLAGTAAAGAQVLGGLHSAEVVIERRQSGKPHQGKTIAVIQPHSDDIPIFAAGTVAKLIDEGYRGILIRMTNDDMAGPGTIGDTVLANEKDNDAVARVLGLQKVFNLNYANHQMDKEARTEIRERLIFIFRLMKVDTVICYDPWGHYEENPDHYVTASSVEAACWMSGGSKDYPEHFEAGIQPHSVREKYYFARGPQQVNRIVDISAFMDKKVESNLVNVAQGPAGINGSKVRAQLAREGKKLDILEPDDDTANRNYIKHLVLARDAELGKKHGLQYAEAYHYIGPEPSAATEYIRRNAKPR